MSRLVDEKKYSRKKKEPESRKSTGSLSNFVSFNPTKEQREAIKSSSLSLTENLDYLSTWLQEGHKLSINYNREQEAYGIFLRDGNADWREAVVLSCWHVDWERAISMLCFALNNVHTDFPHINRTRESADLEW